MANIQGTRIVREDFDGMPAWRIENESGASALVAERGASVLSWQPRPGVNVIDGYANAQELREAIASRCAVLVPWPGRVKNASYSFDGNTYQLERLIAGDALHGFAQWGDFTAEQTDELLVLGYDFTGAPGYPWPFKVRVSYSLDASAHGHERLSVTIAATNTGDTDIPMAIGWHPYLQLPGCKTISKYSLEIPARTRILYEADMTPLAGEAAYAGVKAPVVMDYLGQRVMDESYRGLIPGDDGVVNTRVRDVASNAELVLSQEPSEAPVVHVYTADGLSRNERGSLALEPLSALPDAFNRADSAAAIRLRPGDTRQLTATITYIP